MQARAAYSRSGAAVVNNNFQLVKLLLQSWRYAVPLPADAILAHLKVKRGVRSAMQGVLVQACLTARAQKRDWRQRPTMHVQASVTATEKEGNRTALQLRTAGQNRRIVGMKLLSAGVLYSAHVPSAWRATEHIS